MYVKRLYIFLLILLVGLLLYCSSIYRGNKSYHQLGSENLSWLISNNNDLQPPAQDEVRSSVLNKVLNITNCLDRSMVPRTQERGEYWVLYNYVLAERSFRCHETITYTTHGDYSFLDNLLPLVEKWKGPVSIALYAPGTDFNQTLTSIAFLRDCADPLVRELVTFHIYFPKKHMPKWVPKYNNLPKEFSNCSSDPPYMNVSQQKMYRAQKELIYPVNVGRNIARETAQTHFIFPSDIELLPSLNVIPKFLSMIAENKGPLLSKNPKVFPLHPFEVTSDSHVPENKTALQQMLLNQTASSFHKKICPLCHNIPKSEEWQKQHEPTDGQMRVFHVAKRMGNFYHWEPFYIGTHSEPYYDERLSWEGQSDKMTQGYVLCALAYDFLILDNAFLIHKPGLKVYKHTKKRDELIRKTNEELKPIILADLKILFGDKKGCSI